MTHDTSEWKRGGNLHESSDLHAEGKRKPLTSSCWKGSASSLTSRSSSRNDRSRSRSRSRSIARSESESGSESRSGSPSKFSTDSRLIKPQEEQELERRRAAQLESSGIDSLRFYDLRQQKQKAVGPEKTSTVSANILQVTPNSPAYLNVKVPQTIREAEVPRRPVMLFLTDKEHPYTFYETFLTLMASRGMVVVAIDTSKVSTEIRMLETLFEVLGWLSSKPEQLEQEVSQEGVLEYGPTGRFLTRPALEELTFGVGDPQKIILAGHGAAADAVIAAEYLLSRELLAAGNVNRATPSLPFRGLEIKAMVALSPSMEVARRARPVVFSMALLAGDQVPGQDPETLPPLRFSYSYLAPQQAVVDLVDASKSKNIGGRHGNLTASENYRLVSSWVLLSLLFAQLEVETDIPSWFGTDPGSLLFLMDLAPDFFLLLPSA